MTTLCICGAGTMGSGIAQVSATAGYATVLYDVHKEIIVKAREKIESDLQLLVSRQKITAGRKGEILQQLRFTNNIEDCRADLVIEAIVEKPEIKISLFKKLEAINDVHTIYASNTSSLSITELAEQLHSPEQFAGLHFFNPAPVMKLVEVVRAKKTSEAVVNRLTELAKKMGKVPVVCADSPGFIVNRVARPYYIESLRLSEEGMEMEAIDRLLESRGFRMGPFRLMDLIGNDINYAVSCSVYEQLGAPERLKPSPIQKMKLEKGELGKKTGKGYYEYSK